MNESNFSANAILDKYALAKTKILQELSANYKSLQLWGTHLKIDKNCKCQMGVYDSHLTLKSSNMCSQCFDFSLLVELSDYQIGTAFRIQCGKYEGKLLVAEIDESVNPKIMYSSHIKSNLEYLFNYFTSFKACDSTLDWNTEWLALDNFSNKILCNIVLQNIISNKIVTLQTAFICAKDGYIMYDEPNIGFFDGLYEFSDFFVNKNFKPKIVRDILIQICEILETLKAHNFCHNNGTINSLRFDLKDESINVLLSDFEYSAINFGNLRIYGTNKRSELYVKNEPFIPDIKIKDHTETCNPEATYKFNTESGKQIINLRRLGIPIYNTSFDLYSFLISLCAQTPFYNTIILDSKLHKIWQSIWTDNDLKIINYRLSELHKNNIIDVEIEKITEILSSLTLKCDFLSFLSTSLKEF